MLPCAPPTHLSMVTQRDRTRAELRSQGPHGFHLSAPFCCLQRWAIGLVTTHSFSLECVLACFLPSFPQCVPLFSFFWEHWTFYPFGETNSLGSSALRHDSELPLCPCGYVCLQAPFPLPDGSWIVADVLTQDNTDTHRHTDTHPHSNG